MESIVPEYEFCENCGTDQDKDNCYCERKEEDKI